MDLGGTWRATVASEAVRREYPDPGFDDSSWSPLRVPGHWRSTPTFADVDGPLLVRHRFDAPSPEPGRRSFLVFDGVCYQSDVWLDGGYLGDTEGYAVPHAFEVTGALADRREHVLAVELSCPPIGDPRAKRTLTGALQDPRWVGPGWNPGGIWRPVRLVETGAVRIARLRTVCLEATDARAVLALRATLDAREATTARIRTRVAGAEHQQELPLAAGDNRLGWRVTVPDPELWWPHSLGDQPLHDVEVDVFLDGPEPSDRRVVRTGLRQVRMRSLALSVNGERLFLKGASLAPTRPALGDATVEEVEAPLHLAREAGLDMVRVHAHVGRPELYAAADRLGLLVWQDLPLLGGYARGIRKQATAQARAIVDVLSPHPSIAIWCTHDEPFRTSTTVEAVEVTAPVTTARALRAQQLPSWPKTVLDAALTRTLERSDPSRPVIPHSGVLPHAGSGGTDLHVWPGWAGDVPGGPPEPDARDLERVAAVFPRLVRFAWGLSSPSAPHTAGELVPEPALWPRIDREELVARHGVDPRLFERIPPEAHRSWESWRDATQAVQADLTRHSIEALRRLKRRPTGGFCLALLADGRPSISASLVDHAGVPKAAWAAVVEACRPVIVTSDLPAGSYEPGAAVVLDVHVVSDLRVPVHECTVDARVRWPGGAEDVWRWAGWVRADDVTYIGTVQALAPPQEGEASLSLRLSSPTVTATREHRFRIAAAPTTDPARAGARMAP